MVAFSTSRLIALSDYSYRLLLLIYPPAFRRTYGQEMSQTFHDYCRETLHEEGRLGLFHLCGVTLCDILASSIREHLQMLARSLQDQSSLGLEALALTAPLCLQVAQQTDIGRKRSLNEDNLLTVLPDDPQTLQNRGALFVVADGLGGHSFGERASEMVVNTVRETYYQQQEQKDIPTALKRAVEQANEAVYQENALRQPPTDEKHSMGATCIAAVLCENRLVVANVGDSRLYIVHAGQIRQISQDHSVVADMVRAGSLTLEEARHHEKRNIITRCVGIDPTVEIDLFEEVVEENDVLLLCTDGLSNLITETEILKIVETYQTEESVQQLIARANAVGGTDNITAIVVRVDPHA
jgi:PPM family protein phosphatase